MAKTQAPLIDSGLAIVAQDLTVKYDRNVVLDRVSLTLRRGEVLSIVGISGCGKSTLLRALAGFVEFNGQVHTTGAIGFVFQHNPVFPFMTAMENVTLGMQSLDLAAARRRAESFLQAVGLEGFGDRYPAQLSGGQIQRVAIARALAAVPTPLAIMCDEPFASLDVFTRERMQDLVRQVWNEHNLSIVFVTHSIDEAIYLGDRVLVLRDGHIAKEFAVNLPKVRNADMKYSDEFVLLSRQIRDSLELTR